MVAENACQINWKGDHRTQNLQKIFWAQITKNKPKLPKKSTENTFFQQDVHVKVRLMMKTKTIAKGKYYGLPLWHINRLG